MLQGYWEKNDLDLRECATYHLMMVMKSIVASNPDLHTLSALLCWLLFVL